MSINIQLDGKLQKISGQTMTKEKIVEKLGYIPANEATVNATITEHTSDTVAHVNAADRARWDNKSDFSGNYSDLVDAPDIVEDESGNVVYTDEAGNIIFKIDADGAHTTKLELTSGDVDGQLNALDSKIGGVSAALAEHAADTTHITSTERDAWNSKSEFSGEFKDLKNSPITEDESGELVYVDDAGNIIFKVAQDGAHTTELTLAGGKVDTRLNQLSADLAAHKTAVNNNDSTDPIHLQPGERATWNAKATTKYVDDAVAGIVNSAPETLNTLNELATALGNDENFATTVTNELAKKATQADFAEHNTDSVRHITAAERVAWNNKSDVKSYNDLPDAPNIAPEDDEDSLVITDNTGNIVLKAGELDEDTTGLETTTVIADEVKANTAVIGNIYNKTEVDAAITEHKNAIIAHTKAQVGLGNVDNTSDADKPISTATQNALDNLKNELSESITSESESWTIVDNAGNIVLKAGKLDEKTTGLETTTVIADAIEAQTAAIGNIYTKTEVDAQLATKSNTGHDHTISAGAEDDDVIILEGTSGTNGVSYKATHVDSGVTAGTYKSITVDAKGHIISGTNPTTLEGFGITDAYTTTQVDAKVAEVNTNHANSLQQGLDDLKVELSESITTSNDSWTITDEAGNIVAKIGELDNGNKGLETTDVFATTVTANSASIGAVTTEAISLKGTDINTKLSTFELKADAAEKLTEAKEYADDLVKVDSITVQLGEGGTIGGYKTGDVIDANTDIKTILNKLLQKAVPATYTKPTISLANNDGTASGNVEAGSIVTPELRASFTKNDAGALTSIKILKGNAEVATGTATPLDYNGSGIVIGDETISFTATAVYGDAPVKNNNLGEESKENWFAGGSITSSEYKITGKRQLFYGTGAGALPTITSSVVRGLSSKKLAPAAGTSFNINVAIGQQYIVIAYPASLRDVNNITYVEANDSGMASSFTKSTIDVADARGGENGLMSYKVYTYAMAVPAAAAMSFKVTI